MYFAEVIDQYFAVSRTIALPILWVHGGLAAVVRDTLPAGASSGSHIFYSLSLLTFLLLLNDTLA